MAGSVNKVTLVGNVGKDPEIRSLGSGDKCANLTIATSESWKDKSTGERKEKTEWHNVVVFGGVVGVVESYVKKGSKLYLEGALQTRKWQDKDGNDRYSTEIVLKPFNGTLVLLGDPGGGRQDNNGGGYSGGGQGGGQTQNRQQNRQQGGQRESFSADLDGEIPF